MSVAYLKTLLFPTVKRRCSPNSRYAPSTKLTDLATDDNKAASTATSSTRTLDVEAQQCDACRPRWYDEKAKKKRFSLSPRMISDAIIGLSDGLTVPFALTAGLSSLGDTRLVVLGGLAELIAGAISMGLGGFVGAKSEADSYKATVATTEKLIATSPCQTTALIQAVFKPFGISAMNTSQIAQTLRVSPEESLEFLMRFHHQMPEPETRRPFVSAATISLGYFLGGFVPLVPYFAVERDEVLLALWWSIGMMVIALSAFGWVKTGVVRGFRGRSNVMACITGAVEMVVVGSLAAGAAVGLVRAINH